MKSLLLACLTAITFFLASVATFASTADLSPAVSDVSKNFSGAELENAVQDAMYEAFYSDEQKIKPNHLVEAMSSTVPLAQTMGPVIDNQREWAKSNCRMAQRDDVEKILSVGDTQTGRKVVI